MFVIGLELFTGASLLCAVAPSVGALVAFRVLQAMGAALLVPASLALVLHAFPPEHRSHGVALLAAVAAGAAGLGPSLGGLLIAASDWRLVFLVNIPIGIAAVVLTRRLIVESRAPGRRRMPDLLGAVMFAVAVAALVLAIVKGQEWGWGSLRILGLFTASIGLGALFVWRCSWHRSAVIDLRLLRIRSLSASNGMTLVAAAGYYGYTLTNVLFLTGVWHYSILQAGLALTPGPFVAAAVAGPSSRLVLRIGHRPVLVAGGLIWGAAVLWFVERVGPTPDFVGTWLPGIVLLGIGAGTLFPNLTSAAVAAAPGHMFATATGINSVARQVGAALGVALVVAIIGAPSPLEAQAAFQNAWTFGSACLFAAGLGCLLVGRLNVEDSPSLGDATRTVLRSASREEPTTLPTQPQHALRLLAPPRRMHAESAAEFFAKVSLFADIEPSLRNALADRSTTAHLDAGQWLFHQNDSADSMYVVRVGRLHVIDERSGALLRELGRGDAVGELALLTRSDRSAGVRAVRSSDLIAIARTDFESVLPSSSALPLALTRTLAEQLRATGAAPPTARPMPSTVAVVRLGAATRAEAVPLQLGAALARYQMTEVLNGSEIGEPRRSADAGAVYGPLLDAAEASHDLVVLDAGALGSGRPWDEFCLQQADRILAVLPGGQRHQGVPIPRELHGCDLVPLDVAPGTGTIDGWAEILEPTESHVLRGATFSEDLARIARRLSGQSVGIVLSGGGARAFAHIGVLEELTAAGVTIDRVLGVSMGAFVGALFALGLDADAIDACCFDEWVQRRPLGDYTIPRHSLIRGERFRSMLGRTFGQIRIEELERSYMCACTELRSGRLVLSRSGPLQEAVGFSICLPILAPPQVRGRELFIDGSLVDNLPVGIMANLGEGPVIAVDVKASFDHKQANASTFLTSNGIARSARNSGSHERPLDRSAGPPRGSQHGRAPRLGETLTRVLLLGSANTAESAARHADLVIKPRAEGVGLLEFHQLDIAREAGRAAAREALEQASGVWTP
jgi:EmrB/QacA subfamily drug resistance transporter